jgi:hypothetical protein
MWVGRSFYFFKANCFSGKQSWPSCPWMPSFSAGNFARRRFPIPWPWPVCPIYPITCSYASSRKATDICDACLPWGGETATTYYSSTVAMSFPSRNYLYSRARFPPRSLVHLFDCCRIPISRWIDFRSTPSSLKFIDPPIDFAIKGRLSRFAPGWVPLRSPWWVCRTNLAN